MKIKVCGMKDPQNIEALGKLPVDFMGLIFYPKSPRYINDLDPQVLNVLPKTIERVGVFVNEDIEVVSKQIAKYNLNKVQLHGQESAEYCSQCKSLSDVEVIKAFNVSEEKDFEQTKEYETVCDYFLFDTKTKHHGGSGLKFDWSILEAYKGETPFLLSGGISVEDVENIKSLSLPKLYALDLNSKFETEPGIKDIPLIEKFIKELRYE
ncbi:phosphoribosylanthranilate isomerase [Dysgonomonas sp. ZJ709]|uniref:phosphoribosylanthranilate isomerase n=1 Tax=Dysgonomonas sp. ZJ709 TaxID=2709797 RepID=UPI0013ED73A2|nr:phosphoribosylanthranilate isomerase [Dysgonomonas sp. ZJ709]